MSERAGSSSVRGQKNSRKPNSDIRKEQNRIASKAYREKRRQRLALLDQLLDPLLPESSAGPSSSSTSESHQDVTSTTGGSAPLAVTSQESDVFMTVPDQMLTSPFTLETSQASSSSGDASFQDLLFIDSWPSLPGSLTAFESLPTSVDSPFSSLASMDPPPPPPPPPPAMSSSGLFPTDDELLGGGSNAPPASPPSPEDVATTAALGAQLVQRSPPPLDLSDSMSPVAAALRVLNNLSVSDKRILLAIASRSIGWKAQVDYQDGVDDDDDGIAKARDRWIEYRLRVESAAQPGPSNSIFMSASGFTAAAMANALACGLKDNHVLWNEESKSPFCMDLMPGRDADKLQLARRRFSAIARDLQPVDNQILIDHHPYIDVIPFRSFREKVISAISCNPPLIDEDELCMDLLREAMVCWGSRGNPQSMDAALPWDVRSWEPRVWFLRKYWFLVGGWDDEMWSSARWWHSIRGEKIETPSKP